MKTKIKTFNSIFWICLAIPFVCAYFFRLYFIKNGLDKAINLFYIIHIIEIVYYLIYKIALCNDEEYKQICIDTGSSISEYLSELIPLQLCNVSYIVIPLAFLTKNPHMLSYGMLITPIGTAIALLFPCVGLTDGSIFKLRINGYYFTHLYLIFMCCVVWILNPVPLNYMNAFEANFIVIIISFIAHIVNLILVKTKLCVSANYFFTLNPNVNPVLAKCYSILPINWVYELPLFAIGCLILLIVIFIIKLF